MPDIQLDSEGEGKYGTEVEKPKVISPFPPVENGYIIGYSGGKDSLCVMDMCYRRQQETGCTLKAFFMELVPNMDYTKFWVDYALRRWGIETITLLHWQTYGLLRDGVFRPQPDYSVRRFRIAHIERRVRKLTGLHWIAYGFKKIDSLQRRGMMNKWPNGINADRGCFAPLHGHNDHQVLAYLRNHHIPVPQSVKGTKVGGIDLTPNSLAYVKKNWPEDYKRILALFPLAEGHYTRAKIKPRRFQIPDSAI